MGRRAHWIDPQTNRRLDYTKIIPEANIELSGTWQMEFYTENPATHFQNGILSDLEVLAIKRFKGGFGISFVESWIQQVNDDEGAPATLDGFSGRAFGIGPIVAYSTKLGKRQRVQFQRELEILITSKQTANQFNRFHNRKIANACDRIVLENVLRRATISGPARFHWNDGMPLMSPCSETQEGNVEKL